MNTVHEFGRMEDAIRIIVNIRTASLINSFNTITTLPEFARLVGLKLIYLLIVFRFVLAEYFIL